MAASPSRRPSPHALRLPKPSLVIACARSRLRPKIVRVDAALELLQALPSWAKILPRAAGLHFAVRTGDGRVTPYTLCDQGRNLGRARGSMGLGVKLTAPRLPQGREREQLAALEPAPLPFAVVCVLRDPARVDEALAMCRARGLGGEAGYGLLRPTRRLVLVYDVARSPARQATRGFAAYGARWAAVRGAGLVNLTFAAGLARATVSIPPRVFYAYQSLVGGVPVAVHARRRGVPSLKTAWDYYCLAAPLVPELRVHGKAHVHPDLWRVLASMRGDARLGGRLRLLHPPVVRRLGRDVPMQELRFARTCFV